MQSAAEITELHRKALEAANAAARAEDAKLGPESSRGFDCGFAWVIAAVKLNTKEGRALKALGFQKMGRDVCLWMPAKTNSQSVSVHYAGAEAYADAMKASGIEMFPCSRLD